MGVTDTNHEDDILRIVRAKAQRLSEMLQRELRLAIKSKRITEKSMRCGKIRIELKCVLKRVNCCIGLSAHGSKLAEGKMRPRVASVQSSGSDCKLSSLV